VIRNARGIFLVFSILLLRAHKSYLSIQAHKLTHSSHRALFTISVTMIKKKKKMIEGPVTKSRRITNPISRRVTSDSARVAFASAISGAIVAPAKIRGYI